MWKLNKNLSDKKKEVEEFSQLMKEHLILQFMWKIQTQIWWYVICNAFQIFIFPKINHKPWNVTSLIRNRAHSTHGFLNSPMSVKLDQTI